MPHPYEAAGMGWLPDYPDLRDYTAEHDEVQVALKTTKVLKAPRAALPAATDLRAWCSPIEDQQSLGSCTANAGVGILEYFERRAHNNHVDGSRLFLYKATRNLLKWTGDQGAFLRTTMAALVAFGVPPEQYWPYRIADFEKEPPAFCYAFAQNYQAISYYRLDPPGTTPQTLLERIRKYLAAGLPSMFGFTVYDSISQASNDGKIPYPTKDDRVAGGHAIVAVGYDDKLKIKNAGPGGQQTTGALLIRNSWGSSWGDNGYGWLPYEYISTGLATDWWSLSKAKWFNTGNFGL